MQYNSFHISEEKKLELYKRLLLPRRIEEKMISLLRQGKISKWFSGIGQEAISVGCTEAINPDEWIFTLHRNLGVFTSRNVPLDRLFCQWQGKEKGFTKGRDRSFHFGTKEYHIAGMISHLGPQLSVASGVALAYKLRKERKASLVFTGEGGTSEGDFHEALNVSSVWKLPVIFVIENNGYGLSTPVHEQYNCQQLADRAVGYGMKTKIIDGNNILEVYSTIQSISEKIRENPEPYLVECMTFRMRGHEEASGTKYVPDELMEEWVEKDPLLNYKNYLFNEGILNEHLKKQYEDSISETIRQNLETALNEPSITANVTGELKDVFASFDVPLRSPFSEPQREMRYIDAISEGLTLAMENHDELILMGQDIAEYGGVFKVTEGLFDKFGAERVKNTPLCESAIIGIALGLSIEGIKSMVEMQFADFVSCGFNQIANNLAKTNYRWGQNADVVIRMPTGAGVGAGPFHSQSTEAWFAHIPGLKIVYPSNPYDAKGMLLRAFEDPNPVLYFEHKALYRASKGVVPPGYYTADLEKARVIREGRNLSIITYGLGVNWAEDSLDRLQIDAEIIDLRCLNPMDFEAIKNTVKKTSRVLILHEDTLFGGIGGEIAAYIAEHLFEFLDAPVMRLGSLDTPVPFARSLEENFLAKARLDDTLIKLIQY